MTRTRAIASAFALSSFFASVVRAEPTRESGSESKLGSSTPRFKLGTPASILKALGRVKGRSPRAYTFSGDRGQEIPAVIESYYFENGRLSMTGVAKGSQSSSFILKGDSSKLYGWIVLRDRDLAYEYTTSADGTVVVEQVPVTKIYPICNMQHRFGGGEPASAWKGAWLPRRAGPEPHIGDYDGTTNVNTLQSLPGATLVMYLDITRIMDGEDPITLSSKAEMWKMWQAVASTLSMYEINVTTDAGVYAAAGVPSSGIACFYNQDGRSNSPLNAFGTTQCSNNYKNIDQGYGLGRTAAHEIGHTMGLSHDRGQPGGEYFQGLPEFEWCPIMGNYWYGDAWEQALYQWSKGEYTSATNFQDDLDLIKQHLPFRKDDILGSVPLMLTGTEVAAENNRGQIAPIMDSDSFSFETGALNRKVRLKVDRTEYIGGAMLDVAAEIKNRYGATVAASNVTKARYAEFDVDLPPGEYTLVVKGGAEGTPSHGFSTYSSLGFYAIEGTIDDNPGTGGTGGASGVGGSAGTGGMGAEAGTSGSGGESGTGGDGAASGMGGEAGTGAAGGEGGSGGGGGNGGSGGSGGGGGAGSGGAGGSGADAGAAGDAGTGGDGGSGGSSGSGGEGGDGGSGGDTDTGGSGGGGGSGQSGSGGAGSGGVDATPESESEADCACRVGSRRASGLGLLGALGLAGVLRRRARRG